MFYNEKNLIYMSFLVQEIEKSFFFCNKSMCSVKTSLPQPYNTFIDKFVVFEKYHASFVAYMYTTPMNIVCDEMILFVVYVCVLIFLLLLRFLNIIAVVLFSVELLHKNNYCSFENHEIYYYRN